VAAAVSGLSCISKDSQSVDVSWSRVNGAEVYLVQYKLSTSSDYITLTELNALSVQLANLLPATSYSIRIKAIDGSSYGPIHGISCTTLYPPPNETTSPQQTDVNAQIAWSLVLKYKVTSANDSAYVFTGMLLSSPYSISGLNPNTSYTVHVKALGGMFGPVVTFSTLLSAPATVYQSGVTHNSMQITWTGVLGATRYILQYKPSYGSVYTTMDPAYSPQNISNVAPTTTYNVQVMALGGRINGTNVTTSAVPVPVSSPITISYTANDGWVRWTVAAGSVFDHFMMYATNSSGTRNVNCGQDTFKPLDVLLGVNPIPVGAYTIRVDGYNVAGNVTYTKTLNVPCWEYKECSSQLKKKSGKLR
jgi:Fibronectin type III domain